MNFKEKEFRFGHTSVVVSFVKSLIHNAIMQIFHKHRFFCIGKMPVRGNESKLREGIRAINS